MASIPDKSLETIKDLYYKKFYNARKIAEKFKVSIDAVYYFMRHHGLKRRSFSEENKLRFDNKKLSFTVKKKLSQKEKELKAIGVMLYWGEGYKARKSSGIDFVNSDPDMIVIFLSFLRKICGIQESRLRVLLYCYSNQKINKLIAFWNKKTKIPRNQFTKPYIRNNFNIHKMQKMPYGLVHIRYNDKKLLFLIKKWIDDYKRKYEFF
jgi:predicted DNA-binding protein YlxM (UPF0122 family)